ncbi:MAG: hypothetical protein RMM17_12425 [Acidobacteriota bacterium]|nr:hypothetical protein [Blastocatellia bacterium]MDW8413476.1 hypothetical protein [Acidobacteriota bacterium]
MGFLGGVGKVFSGVFNAVRNIASSGLGKTLIGIAGRVLGGPLGGIIANAATSLLSKGKLDFKNLLKTGLNIFGGIAGKFGLSDVVKNLPSILKNPTGLLGSIGKLFQGGIGKVIGDLINGTGLGKKIGDILNKVTGFLGKVAEFGSKVQDVLKTVTDLLGKFGIQVKFLNDFAEKLSAGLNMLNKIIDIANKINGIFNDAMQLLRA